MFLSLHFAGLQSLWVTSKDLCPNCPTRLANLIHKHPIINLPATRNALQDSRTLHKSIFCQISGHLLFKIVKFTSLFVRLPTETIRATILVIVRI